MENGNGDAAPVLPGPLPMTVNIRSAPGATPFVLITFTTPAGPQCYWLPADNVAGFVEMLTRAALHANTGLVLPGEGTT